MSETQPTGEQIRFRSSKSGEHVLDTYLEAAEIGNRQLYDMLDDLFDGSNSGLLKTDIWTFRYEETSKKLQVRSGDASTSFVDITSFFKARGTFSSSNTYHNLDIVTVANTDVYIVDGVATSGVTFGSEGAFTSAATTTKLIDVSGAAAQATAAAASATAAATSATGAATSATTATTQASTATTKASEASTSATNAATSATSAATSATNSASSATASASSATSASSSASTATTKASEASTSATNAASSATSATNSASTATTKASEASTSATNAAASATTATTQAGTATTQAGTATTKASEAATSATNAASSATSAASSATSATSSASSATSSASAAATSATNAAASYDSFDDRYLGAKSSAPSADNDGATLIVGAMYFNSTNGSMQVWDGSNWEETGSSVSGIKTDFIYTATANQTVFSGNDTASNSLVIDEAGLINVYLNGIRIIPTTDYTVNTGANSVTLTAGADAGDHLEVEVFGNFNAGSGNNVAITGGAISGTNVTVGSGKTLDVSAGTLTLANDQISGDKVGGGTINSTFSGNLTGNVTGNLTGNVTGNLTGNVTGNASGTAATVTGAAQTNITSLGALTALDVNGHTTVDVNGEAMYVTTSGAATNSMRVIGSHASYTGNILQPWSVRAANSAFDFIECVGNNGSEVPFRVRGDGQVTTTGTIGVGTAAPGRLAHLSAAAADTSVLRIESTGSHVAGVELLSGHGNWGVYNSDTVADALEFRDDSAAATRMIINSVGDVGVGTTAPSAFGGTTMQVHNASTYSALLVSSNDHVLQMLASDTHGAQSIGTRSNHDLNLTANDSVKVTVKTDGKVGIGSTAPIASLSLAAQSSDTALSGTGNAAGLHMYMRAYGISQIDSLGSGGNNSGLSLRTYNNGTYTKVIENIQGNTTTFQTAGTERARISTSGEFSVGTTSASGMINVQAPSWSKNCLYLRSSTSGDADFCGIGMVTAGTESANIFTDESHNFYVTKTGGFNVRSGSSGISGGTTNFQVDVNGNVAMGIHGGTLATFAADKSNGSGLSMVTPDGDALQIYQLKTSDVESHIGFKSGTDTNWYMGTGSGLGGIGSAGVYQTNTAAGWTNVSDERYKKSLQPITNALDKIKDCRGMTGLYKTDPDDRERRSFLIAQDWLENDLGPVLPEVVDQNTTDDDGNEKLGMQYDATIPLLVECIKELRTQNLALTERINILEGE